MLPIDAPSRPEPEDYDGDSDDAPEDQKVVIHG
jgi:hypothetical protein